MNFKRRLILSNIVLVFVPVAITFMAAALFLFISTRFLSGDINHQEMKKLISEKLELLEAKNRVILQNPEKLEEASFQQEIAKNLEAYHVGIALIKDNRILFSSPEMGKIEGEKILLASSGNIWGEGVELGGIPYSLQITSVNYKDGNQGKVVLLYPADRKEKKMEQFLILVGAAFLISFIAVNLILTVYISRKILKPVLNLKNAVNAIIRGNMDTPIIEEGDGEVREICHDFEIMRLKLKDAIHLQAKYDENRKTLVSSISHDLKTPLTSIKGYVEGIRDGVAATPEKMNRYLDTISAKANQMDRMIEDLLLYSKLDLNQIPFQFEKTNPVAYIQEWLKENEGEFQKKDVRVTLETTFSREILVSMDRERMQRVINNIVYNAIKYGGKDPCILNISIRETRTSLILEFADNGEGIPEAELEKIFDKFYRGDKARSDTSGSGLGLAIARQIVEAHGGKVWVVSTLGEGTRFMISLEKLNYHKRGTT